MNTQIQELEALVMQRLLEADAQPIENCIKYGLPVLLKPSGKDQKKVYTLGTVQGDRYVGAVRSMRDNRHVRQFNVKVENDHVSLYLDGKSRRFRFTEADRHRMTSLTKARA